MNHAEEAALWYLRLNGFFPIANFVIHRSGDVRHTSDCDVLGVRFPHVYEEVGGQSDDWDPFLRDSLDLGRPIGVICEVKSGRYKPEERFRDRGELSYCVQRLGFAPMEQTPEIVEALLDQPVVELDDGTQVAKLVIARHPSTGPFLLRELAEVHGFLRSRVKRYPKEKYRDRIFFGPVLFQTIIELTADGQEMTEED